MRVHITKNSSCFCFFCFLLKETNLWPQQSWEIWSRAVSCCRIIKSFLSCSVQSSHSAVFVQCPLASGFNRDIDGRVHRGKESTGEMLARGGRGSQTQWGRCAVKELTQDCVWQIRTSMPAVADRRYWTSVSLPFFSFVTFVCLWRWTNSCAEFGGRQVVWKD